MVLITNRNKKSEKHDYTDERTGEKILSYNKQKQLIADFEKIAKADTVTAFVDWIVSNNELPEILNQALQEMADDYIK